MDRTIQVFYRRFSYDRFERIELTVDLNEYNGRAQHGIHRHVADTGQTGDYFVLFPTGGYLYHAIVVPPKPESPKISVERL